MQIHSSAFSGITRDFHVMNLALQMTSSSDCLFENNGIILSPIKTMPDSIKRLRAPTRSISPPPLRRQRPKPNTPVSATNLSPTFTNSISTTATIEKEAAPPNAQPYPRILKPSNLRIFSWNVNGITPFIQKSLTAYFTPSSSSPTQSYSLRGILLHNCWPQIFCLQEVKIAFTDLQTQKALERAANISQSPNDSGPTYSAFFCLPHDKHNARSWEGKVYGVATFVCDDILDEVLRTREVEWDVEGRVLITELRCKIAVINSYWVNGTDSPYKNPKTGEVMGTRHDRKREFHRLMLEECKSYEKRGWHVVVVGDVNVARSEIDGFPNLRMGKQHVRNRKDFNEKFFSEEDGLRAVDVFRKLHGKERKYTYYNRNREWGTSCDRVDLIMMSKELAEMEGVLVDAGILNTEVDRGHSDHVPLYVTLDLEKVREILKKNE
jgi:exonuclease III